MAPTFLSPIWAISRAAPAVSACTIGAMLCFFRKPRHWASAWTWLLAILMPLIVTPGSATRQCSTRWKCSATILSLVCGSRLCRSATRPAIEFSTGIMASSALPRLDRAHGGIEGRAGQRRHVGKGRAAGHVRIGPGLALEGDGVGSFGLGHRSPRPEGKKPRKIRDLRRSAARATRPYWILLRVLGACYSNARKIRAAGSPRMASFNTVAGCVLASALLAMVIGKVSNAVVHPHKLDKPAIAVVDEAAGPGRARRAAARSWRRSGPSSPAPTSRRARRSISSSASSATPSTRAAPTRSVPTSGTSSASKKASHAGLQLLLGAAGQGRRMDLRRSQPHDLQADRLRARHQDGLCRPAPRSRIAPT